MNQGIFSVLSFVVIAIGLPAPVRAEGPTFNCAKAQGEVEKLICSDASLAASEIASLLFMACRTMALVEIAPR